MKAHDELLERESYRETVLGFTNIRSHIMQSGMLVDLHGRISDQNSTLTITNYSPNKAIFREGTKLVYRCDFKTQPLQGVALKQLIDNKDIFPSNSHWDYIRNYSEWHGTIPVGLEFSVSPQQFSLKKRKEPVIFNGISETTHNRGFVDENLEQLAQQSDRNHFWIGKLSPKLYISEKVHLVITGVRTIADIFPGMPSQGIAAHAPSLFNQGGHTGRNWSEGNEMRLEIFGPSGGVGKIAAVDMLCFPF